MSVVEHYACPSCGYSGSTMGHASFVKPGVRCHHCDDAEYEEYVPAEQLREAVSALEDAIAAVSGPVRHMPSPAYTPQVSVERVERWRAVARGVAPTERRREIAAAAMQENPRWWL